MRGLGILQTSATGVSSVAKPSCITAAEKAEANSKCTAPMLRGLGDYRVSTAPMTGRLAAIPPCDLADLPVCVTPTCLDQYTAGLISECVSGNQANPDFDCNSLYTYALAQLPFCSSDVPPTIPSCLSPAGVAMVSFCGSAAASKNGTCWILKHDPAYWARLQATPQCGTGQPLAPPRIMPRQPSSTPVPPPLAPPPPLSPPAPPPKQLMPPATSNASMSGTWGILALIAAAGGGYYLYRRYKT